MKMNGEDNLSCDGDPAGLLGTLDQVLIGEPNKTLEIESDRDEIVSATSQWFMGHPVDPEVSPDVTSCASMASCIAVLSPTNCPLFCLSADPSSTLSDHYAIHTSIDVIEEKTGSGLGSTSSGAGSGAGGAKRPGGSSAAEQQQQQVSRELYLGCLYATEKKKVFGYVTNTRIKFVIIVEAANASLRDNEIRQMFRRLHTAYTQLLSNPFYVPGDKISSKKFQTLATSLLTAAK